VEDLLAYDKEKYQMFLKLYKGQISFKNFQNDVFLGEQVEFEEAGERIEISENDFQEYVLLEINKEMIREVQE
jgi:hypothetical protein